MSKRLTAPYRKMVHQQLAIYRKMLRYGNILRPFQRTKPAAKAKAGLPPGTIVFVGQQRVDKVTISLLDYDEERLQEQVVENLDTLRSFVGRKSVTWINVCGVHDTAIIARIGELLDLHPLILEDIASTTQRPKIEEHDDYIFMILKMLYWSEEKHCVSAEQVSIVLGKDYVLTFQEVEGDVFELIRKRIRDTKGRIRRMGGDYLAYSLVDAIVDNYFVVMEHLGDGIDQLQEVAMAHTGPAIVQQIQRYKGEMLFLRKNVWPMREVVSSMEKLESKLLHRSLRPYLRDVYEHSIQVIDTMDALRDMVAGAQELHMTTVSNRMNDVMKTLTVIATIFIPLTFIAGIYGMNFDTMPELHWKWGYPAVWGVMVLTTLAMLAFFKRRTWL